MRGSAESERVTKWRRDGMWLNYTECECEKKESKGVCVRERERLAHINCFWIYILCVCVHNNTSTCAAVQLLHIFLFVVYFPQIRTQQDCWHLGSTFLSRCTESTYLLNSPPLTQIAPVVQQKLHWIPNILQTIKISNHPVLYFAFYAASVCTVV